MKLRRHRRWVLSGAVALSALVALDQGGMVAIGDRPAEVAGARFTSSPTATAAVASFENLGARLRLPTSTIAPSPAPVEAGLVAGDVAIAPPPDEFSEPAPPPPPAPEEFRASRLQDATLEGGTWAVVIGINDYPGSAHDLKSAVNDANDVTEALGRVGVPGNRRLVLRDGQATARSIRSSVEWLKSHAGPDATAVFFYAGHIRKLGAGSEAIVGADGGVVSDAELARLMDDLQARRVWIGLAACYAGGFNEVMKPGRILTAAASANNLAYENEGFGRSYLVEYMVRRAMIQSGITTVEGAFAAAESGLRKDYPHRAPVQFDDLPGNLELRVGPPPPPPRQPSSGSAGGNTGGGSGSPPSGDGSGQNPPSNPPPEQTDGCASLTIGVIRCNSS